MYVKVLYDDRAKKGLVSGRGFSCVIDGKILFDTGEASNSLVENMERMMVSPEDLEAVIISHEHWDHTGGLWEILKRKSGLKVYACPSFSDTFKDCVKELGGELILADGMMDVTGGIMVTGEIYGTNLDPYIPEQALIIKGDKGVSVVTGCAHPGLMAILKKIKRDLNVDKFYMVFGGFHLGDLGAEQISDVVTGMKSLGVYKVGPMHCTGDKAIRVFGGQYHGNFIAVKAGHVIHL